MSFAEFNQAKGELTGIVAFEAGADRSVTPPDEGKELIHPSVSTDDDTGSFIVFNLPAKTWGIVARSTETPYNDCLPPGDTYLLEAFRRERTPEDILDFLEQRTEDAFVNSFEAAVANLEGSELQHFVGSVQSRHETLPLGHYRVSDTDALTSVPDPPDAGLPHLIAGHASPDEITRSLTDEVLKNRLENDGMRELAYVLVFHWDTEGLDYRAGRDREELASSGLTSIQSG